jgi:hypothetical protein
VVVDVPVQPVLVILLRPQEERKDLVNGGKKVIRGFRFFIHQLGKRASSS